MATSTMIACCRSTTNSGRRKTSPPKLGQVYAKGASLVRIRSGKVTRLVLHWDCERALADLDLAA
jgi:hypothetical protein